MKKILILSMSCNDSFFISQEEDVKNTWAKDIIDGKYENIDFIIYRGNCVKNTYSKKEHLLKLNVYDDIPHTFLKTYMALSTIWNSIGQYDYVFRTNTSTYVNVELLNAFIQSLENDDTMYGSDIYSLSEKYCPYPLCLHVRGNGILLPRKHVEIILKESLDLLYHYGVTDDEGISCVINSHYIKNMQEYKDHLKGWRHGWYKCTDTTVESGNTLCCYNCDEQDPDFWKSFITVQMKAYNHRELDHHNYEEFHKIMTSKQSTDASIMQCVNLNKDHTNNYQVFIGSILGYVNYQEWVNTDKYKLYQYEVTYKASDDPAKNYSKEPLKYVKYHGSNKMLI